MIPWVEHFSLNKEQFKEAPLWIRLYLLPKDYWELETLEGIDNTLERFVKVSEATQ